MSRTPNAPDAVARINWRHLNTANTSNMSWKAGEKLMDTIRHYASFPATGVSLRQMVQFGEKPSTGELPRFFFFFFFL